MLQKIESKDQREISQCLWPVVDSVVDVNGDVFCPYSETAVLAHKRNVDIIGETIIRSIHTSVGIAQLQFKLSLFSSQSNSCYAN